MIEIIGYIFGVGFLTWLGAGLALLLVAMHWEDR